MQEPSYGQKPECPLAAVGIIHLQEAYAALPALQGLPLSAAEQIAVTYGADDALHFAT